MDLNYKVIPNLRNVLNDTTEWIKFKAHTFVLVYGGI